jgi:hypothetical protein
MNQTAEIETPWMDAKKAAVYIGRKGKFAYRSVVRAARAGKLRAGHDGKRFLFAPNDLDNWLYLQGKKEAHP